MKKYLVKNLVTKEDALCEKFSSGFDYYKNEGKDICTTNPGLNIPQVVDLVEFLGTRYEPNYAMMQEGFKHGYKSSQSTHPFTADDVLSLIQSLKDYTRESGTVLGFDEREPSELLSIWQQQQPIKIYCK